MKKLLFSLLTASAFFLAGCLETTQEITIKEDGSGTASYTSDMSALMAMVKQMGSGADTKDMDKSIDSTVSLKEVADSIEGLTDAQKAMLVKSELRISMDMKSEKFFTKLNFPFASTSEIAACNELSAKVMGETLKGQTAGLNAMSEDGAGMPQMSSFDDYYTTVYANGSIVRTLNKEKYEKVGEDEYFKGMKETAAMGLSMKANYIINLPRPAKTAEGKGITLSEDKKKITISVDMDDFFDDPSKLEYKIEY
jgi:hypothetical protein